ncbi:alpha-ketoglutarate dehydrogenase component 4-like isoform X2 [Physella acuta]|uniref:alpha-ketoglutarate dehydrogenase component 4-like isoform X2 n=1 Tax=Physella acuta TaxID=109671 RepID=UPI0027DC8837|nr:alpha-ketoglutarate dehydrogenase component 4-like isoform X2 [Physella acuta]
MHSFPLIKNNMAAAAATRKIIQAVKPHVPSIKFPPRDTAKKFSGDKGSTTANITQGKSESLATPKGHKSPSSGQSIESFQLPLKYHRKPLSNEEMEAIEKGGRV